MATLVQPLSPDSGPNHKRSGCHWICVLFLNFNAICWEGGYDPDSNRPVVLIFDSMQPSMGLDDPHLSIVKRSFQEYLACEGSSKHSVPLRKARHVSQSIPWRLVCSANFLCIDLVC